ncbi:MAG: hypothetical protein DWQ19_11455 [Crenarchaeota archaeon]|nr:MAG: hypothetical protein DWQ19_11455 [Thermoproteota archaeon]
MYLLLVLNEADEIVERIEVTHQNDKETLKKTKEKYKGRNFAYKFGNTCTPEQFKEVENLLDDVFAKYPEMGNKYIKDHPDMVRIGYNINEK